MAAKKTPQPVYGPKLTKVGGTPGKKTLKKVPKPPGKMSPKHKGS